MRRLALLATVSSAAAHHVARVHTEVGANETQQIVCFGAMASVCSMARLRARVLARRIQFKSLQVLLYGANSQDHGISLARASMVLAVPSAVSRRRMYACVALL